MKDGVMYAITLTGQLYLRAFQEITKDMPWDKTFVLFSSSDLYSAF